MKSARVLLTFFLVAQISAQTRNPLSSLISEVFSIFTSVTSVLGQTTSTPSAATPTATTDAESATTTVNSSATTPTALQTSSPTSSQSAPTGSSSITSAASLSSSASVTPQTTSPSSLNTASITDPSSAAAASTSAAAATGNNGIQDRTLAIILGTVLGALALGLLLLLVLVLCYYRKRRGRGAKIRNGSLDSTDEAFVGPRPMSSRRKPMTPLFAHGRRSLTRRNHAGKPYVSSQSNYDVPSAHEFQDGDTVPFVPMRESARSSRVMPAEPETALGGASHYREGTGLNNHPYHDSHHTGPILAAGAGGAALGAAAAKRHSQSSERPRGPRLSGDADTHPEFWDEPPPRSSKRSSFDSARRSGSMPRGTFYGPTEHAGSPLRSNMSAAATGGMAGVAASAATDRIGRRSHERGRPSAADGSPYGSHPYHDRYATTDRGGDGIMSPSHRNHREDFDRQTLTGAPRNHSNIVPAAGAAAIGAGVAHHSRSRSRSQPQQPLPPSLVVGNSAQKRHLPSRSPKRARFSQGDTYHQIPHHDDQALHDNDPISPQATSTASHFRDSAGRPIVRDSTWGEDLVSPISPQDRARELPFSRGSVNNRPRSGSISPPTVVGITDTSPPSSTSPPPYQPVQSAQTTAPSYPSVPISRTKPSTRTTSSPARRHPSGLINAVTGHFQPTTPTATAPAHDQHQTQNYQAYIPETIRPSAFSDPTNTTGPTVTSTKPPKPISRKPVPFSQYNTVRSPSYQPLTQPTRKTGAGAPLLGRSDGRGDIETGGAVGGGNGGDRYSGRYSSGDEWWRGEEDSAWQQSYSDPDRRSSGVGMAR